MSFDLLLCIPLHRFTSHHLPLDPLHFNSHLLPPAPPTRILLAQCHWISFHSPSDQSVLSPRSPFPSLHLLLPSIYTALHSLHTLTSPTPLHFHFITASFTLHNCTLRNSLPAPPPPNLCFVHDNRHYLVNFLLLLHRCCYCSHWIVLPFQQLGHWVPAGLPNYAAGSRPALLHAGWSWVSSGSAWFEERQLKPPGLQGGSHSDRGPQGETAARDQEVGDGGGCLRGRGVEAQWNDSAGKARISLGGWGLCWRSQGWRRRDLKKSSPSKKQAYLKISFFCTI